MTVVHRHPLPIEGIDRPTVGPVRVAGLLAEPLTYEEFVLVCDLYDWWRVEPEDGVVTEMPTKAMPTPGRAWW